MIGNAIMLMFIGMGIVFIFLVLLNFAISILERFTREHTRKEESDLAEAELARKKKKNRKKTVSRDGDIQTPHSTTAIHA